MSRARDMAIHDLSSFYASRQFGSYRHAKSAEGRDVIVRAEVTLTRTRALALALALAL